MQPKLSIERIFDSPDLQGPSLRRLSVSPDGQRVTFLRGKAENREQLDLWEYHIDSGETRVLVDSTVLVSDEGELSDEEKARRERQRLGGLRGIIDYQWSPDSQSLLFPLGGDLYAYQLNQPASSAAKQLTASEEFEIDPKLSPKGSAVAFVRNQDLYMVDIASGQEKRLTTGGGGVIKNGMAEFVAQEEMDRDTGYWWSPDESKIAFLQIDESPVEITRRYEIYAEDFKVIEQRYPYAGTPNVIIRLGVVDVDTAKVTWIPLGDEQDIYIPRVKWLPDSQALSFQWQSRDQKTLDLVFADTATGQTRRVLRETSETWINLHHDLKFLNQQDAFVWSSERSGFRHLYLYDLDGKLIRPLTTGDWQVDELEGVDEDAGKVYFTATEKSPLESHLYSQSLNTREPERAQRITLADGYHGINMNSKANVYVDSYSNRDQPLQVSLHRANGQRITWLLENKLDESHPYHPYLAAHRPTDFGTLKAEDGQTLYYRMTTPTGFDESKQYPVFILVYGGPGAQMVANNWSRRILFEQYMAQQGFIVFSLDNRGASRRGTRFENVIYNKMGQPEVRDQLVGVNYLKTLPYVDKDRVGVFGWSYGGYMTLMSMMQNPDAYAMGVSVAPVTDWSIYDTHYTERFMSKPSENEEGYRLGSVFPYAKSLNKPLLIIHGMADDNVLFTHSTKLFEYLQQNGLLFEAMPYPGAKHGISGQASQTHVYRTIANYFAKQIGH